MSFPVSDAQNAQEVWEAGQGAALPTLQAYNFDSSDSLMAAIEETLRSVPVVSIALGGGADASQWEKVLLGGEAGAWHLNQPFSTAGYVKGRVSTSWVNGVVAPTGTPGRVQLETLGGEDSSGEGHGPTLNVREAVQLLRDARIDALKFHPAKGVERLEETVATCRAAAAGGLQGFEPAGGIGPDSILELSRACLDTGIPSFIPHIFGAVIDKTTGRTQPEAVRQMLERLQRGLQPD